ncbi:MAG: hypothetical protein GY878_07155 [Fuerstiella sp.]|nr:hypothetical protein [Fuerstiella sp.]
MPKTLEDAAATRKTAIMSDLIGHCGETLTPEKIDEIVAKILVTASEGATAWAFGCTLGEDDTGHCTTCGRLRCGP